MPAAAAWQENVPALCVGSAAGTSTPKPRGCPIPAEMGRASGGEEGKSSATALRSEGAEVEHIH